MHPDSAIRTLILIMLATTWLWMGAVWSAAEVAWETVPCVPGDLPTEALFETLRMVDDFSTEKTTWTVARGDQNAAATAERDEAEKHAGHASLRIDYDFVGKPEYEYIHVSRPLGLTERGVSMGFWIKHDGTPFPIRLRVADASGETHQLDLLADDKPGWQFVAGDLTGQTHSWGGDGNRRLDYPCTFAGLCIDRTQKGFTRKGKLWIADVALIRARKAAMTLQVETRGKRFGNLYAPGETVSLRAQGTGEAIRWTVRDFWGTQVESGQGPAGGTEIGFKLPKPGYFLCELALMEGARVSELQEFRCAVVPEEAATARSDFFGVCTHFGQQNYPLECMELMCRYGIDQFRDEIHWRACEPKKGQHVLPAYADSYIARAAKLKMRPLIIYDYNNPHYDQDGFPNSPEAHAGFAKYAVELTRGLSGRVSNFEVWNEWVGGCGMGNRPGDHSSAAYGHLLKATYTAVKKEFPDVNVVGIGGEYGPRCAQNVVDSIGTAGAQSMDAFSIHPYRYPRSPEESDLVGEVTSIADRAAAAGVAKKVWITEIGYPTHRTSGGSEETAQAWHGVRTLVLLQSTGVVEKLYWYDLKDDGFNRAYNEDNFGLIRHQQFNCAPKPGVVAMSAFIRMTGAAAFAGLKRQGDLYAATYRRADGGEVLVLWTTGEARQVKVSGKVNAAVDLMGAPMEPAADVKVSVAPLYVTGEKLGLAGP
jgi:hypothetical protein